MNKWAISMFFLVIPNLLHGQEEAKPQPEPLYGLKIDAGNIAIQVKSFGCTSASSFKISTSNQGVIISRIKQDSCRRMPHLVWVSFDNPSLPYPFVIQNPIVGHTFN